jgi:hypothetical protein
MLPTKLRSRSRSALFQAWFFSFVGEILFGLQPPPSSLGAREVFAPGQELQSIKLFDARSVQTNGNGDSVAGIPG